MTPIEQLSREVGLGYFKEGRTYIYNQPVDGSIPHPIIINSKLEALREAIIKDFVNGLDAAGWKNFDEFYHSHDEAKSGSRNWTVQPIPLFDLSQWIDK